MSILYVGSKYAIKFVIILPFVEYFIFLWL